MSLNFPKRFFTTTAAALRHFTSSSNSQRVVRRTLPFSNHPFSFYSTCSYSLSNMSCSSLFSFPTRKSTFSSSSSSSSSPPPPPPPLLSMMAPLCTSTGFSSDGGARQSTFTTTGEVVQVDEAIINKTMNENLHKSLQRTALISRARNSFEQLFLSSIKILQVKEAGRYVEFGTHITQEMCHFEGILHSGLPCALIGNLTGLHSSCMDPQRRVVITTDLNVTFLNKCSIGDQIHISSKILKLGIHFCVAESHIFTLGPARKDLTAGRHSMLFTGTAGQASAFQTEEALGGCDFM